MRAVETIVDAGWQPVKVPHVPTRFHILEERTAEGPAWQSTPLTPSRRIAREGAKC
jgi:hypothetical protein